LLSFCFILIAVLSAKQYFLTGNITYRHWALPKSPGLVMSGWRALGVLVGEASIGVYGMFLVIKSKSIKAVAAKNNNRDSDT